MVWTGQGDLWSVKLSVDVLLVIVIIIIIIIIIVAMVMIVLIILVIIVIDIISIVVRVGQNSVQIDWLQGLNQRATNLWSAKLKTELNAKSVAKV